MASYSSDVNNSKNYAEMFIYDNQGGGVVPTVINVADQYHLIQGLYAEDHINGWTFAAGKLGSGNITTAAAGAAININDVAHGLVTGDYASVQSVNHEGVAVVTYIDNDNFTVPITYVGNEASFWQQGDRLIAGDSAAGTYQFSFSTSLLSAGNSKTYKFEIAVNDVHIDESASERKIGTGSDIGSMSSGGLLDISAGDQVSLLVKNATPDITDLTLVHSNLYIHKL